MLEWIFHGNLCRTIGPLTLHSQEIWRMFSKPFWRYEFFPSKWEIHVSQHGDLELWPMTLSFTHNLDMVLVHHYTKFGDHRSNGSWDMNFFLVTFFSSILAQTDRQTDGQKATHKSPPCMSTGGLNKCLRRILFGNKRSASFFSSKFRTLPVLLVYLHGLLSTCWISPCVELVSM